MIRMLHDWWRGYSDEDMRTALQKAFQARTEFAELFTKREATAYRAYLKKLVLVE